MLGVKWQVESQPMSWSKATALYLLQAGQEFRLLKPDVTGSFTTNFLLSLYWPVIQILTFSGVDTENCSLLRMSFALEVAREMKDTGSSLV